MMVMLLQSCVVRWGQSCPVRPHQDTTNTNVIFLSDIFAFNTNNPNILGGRFYGAIVVLRYIKIIYKYKYIYIVMIVYKLIGNTCHVIM